MTLHPLADNLWIKHYPLTVLGTQHGRNVTLIRLKSGKVVIHSMAPFSPADVAEIRSVGETGWLVEAMLLHDTYAREGRDCFPGVPFFGPPGFSDVAGIQATPLWLPPPEWEGELEVYPLAGVPKLKEYLFLHVASRTLIVADLVFNFSAHEKGWDRFFHRFVAGFKRYPGMSRIFKLCVKNREAFLTSLRPVLSADFDRLIVGHGSVIETGAKALLVRGLENAGFKV